MEPFERALVNSYRHSVAFPLSLRVSEILTHTTFSYPSEWLTSSLLKVSACSPGSRWMASGLWRAKVLG